LAAANCDSLPKLSCLLRVTFAAEIVAPAAKEFSLPNWLRAAKQFSLPNWLRAAKQFSLPNWLRAAKQFSLLNWAACSERVLAADFYNKPPRQK